MGFFFRARVFALALLISSALWGATYPAAGVFKNYAGKPVHFLLKIDGEPLASGESIDSWTTDELEKMVEALMRKSDPSSFADLALDDDGALTLKAHSVGVVFGFDGADGFVPLPAEVQLLWYRQLREGLLEREEAQSGFTYDFSKYRGSDLHWAFRFPKGSHLKADKLAPLREMIEKSQAFFRVKFTQRGMGELEWDHQAFRVLFSSAFGQGGSLFLALPRETQDFLAQKLVRASLRLAAIAASKKPKSTVHDLSEDDDGRVIDVP